MEVMEEYTLEECTVWMEGLDLCRNCPDEREGNTVHPDGYGCYIKCPLPTRCPMNDRDKMREEIAKTLFDWIDDDGWEMIEHRRTGLKWYEVNKEVRDHYRGKVDFILSHLDAQRCEWTEEDGIVQTGCGTELWFDDIVDDHYAKQCPFCPCCGRRIEVKDGQG